MLQRRPSSRLGRWTAVTAVALVVAAAITYASDWASREAAQAVVAHSIKKAKPALTGVDVDIKGAFFLPQLVDGRYGHVHVDLQHVEGEGLVVQTLHADLYGVQVPLARVARQAVMAIPIDHSEEQALITYHALNDYLAANGQPVSVANGNGNQLKINAHLSALGRDLTVSADAKLQPGRNYIDVTPTHLDTGNGVVDRASTLLLRVRLAFRIPTSPLPFGQQVQSLRAGPDGIVVVATGRHVTILP
jgi:LmeA-like phospholipid-binding